MKLTVECPDAGCNRAFFSWPYLYRHIRTKHGLAYRDEIMAGLGEEIKERAALLLAIQDGQDEKPVAVSWRDEAPTGKQVIAMLEAGIPVPVLLTKGEASDAISAVYAAGRAGEVAVLSQRVTLLEASAALSDAMR